MSPAQKQQEYYQEFANRIIQRIKEGTAPWQKPWRPGERFLPENLSSGRNYTAGNSIYLADAAERRGFADNRWATYRQIKALGGHVRQGEPGEKVVFFQRSKRILERDDQGKPKTDAEGNRVYRHERLDKPVWRTYTVFNAEQTAGLKLDRPDTPQPLWKAHKRAEAVMQATDATIRHVQGDRAYYHRNRDEIVLPERGQFPSANHYYQTALHELGHSTGHPTRLDRDTLKDGIKQGFGSVPYAREELRAEISAMMTGERVGAGHDPARGAAYVEGWVQALEEDPREIHRAAADAQRMTNYVLEAARERLQGIDQEIAESARGQEIPRDRAPDRDRPARAPDRTAALEPSR
ncbi:MAG: zincin-like metallopeptidase domain-containing protein [Gemmatimonadota bacterium]|nr:zincin-like metallopeptidase domain-containing protein [Gemmatimonadota bacterium]